MPGLARDDAAITNGLLVYKSSSSQLRFEADMLIAGNAFASGEASGSEDLNAVADGEDPFLLRVKFANHLEQARIIAEVLRSATAQNEDGVIISHLHLVECEVGREAVARALDIGIPPRLEVVHDEMEAANGGCGNGDAPVFLSKPMNRVERFVGFARISRYDQYPCHIWPLVYHPGHAFVRHRTALCILPRRIWCLAY